MNEGLIMNKLVDMANELLADGMSMREVGDLFIIALKSLKEHESENPKSKADKNSNAEVKSMVRTFITEQAEQDKQQALENQKIEFAVSLLDVLDVETIAAKTKLTVEKVKALKEEYLKNKKS